VPAAPVPAAVTDRRPDPDALLERVTREEAARRRGKLKIFFGAAAGVGKTYAMLSAAGERRRQGGDVVVGIVETHGRAETAALLEGLEALPARAVEYRGTVLREFDLDAALARRPQLMLVDELAHSNAPGSRHRRRWQDVEELLAAGIDVYSTLNVQHIESLNDVVGQITGIRVWETVPDTVFEQAAEVELVDLPADELLQRLRDGKVYVPQQAERAIQNFFRKGNLIALREIALRRTAERVDAQMRDYRAGEGIVRPWPAGERVLVCVGPEADNERLVRAGRRIAAALDAEWIAVYVETPALQRLPRARRDQLFTALRLAEELGAETATLAGHDAAAELLQFAQARNVTRLVIGRPQAAGWRRLLVRSTGERILARARDLDVTVIDRDPESRPFLERVGQQSYIARSRAALGLTEPKAPFLERYGGYLWGLAVTAACTGVAALMRGQFELSNLIMVYLLGVVGVAYRCGRGPGVLASVLSVAAFDFFFVPPFLTFAVSDTEYLVTFAVMLAVALVISNLTASVRLQAKVAGYRERRADALYRMSRELAHTQTETGVLRAAVRHVGETFQCQNVILLPNAAGRIVYPRGDGISQSLHGADLSVAQWVYDHGKPAGLGTDTLPGAEALYLPVPHSQGTCGVLALLPVSLLRLFVPEQQRLLETFCSQIGLSLERVRLTREAHDAQMQAQTEQLRNSLLAAISHDLRTPLATIVGASSTLLRADERLGAGVRHELTASVYDEARRISGLVDNVLDMARLHAGALQLERQWYPLEEIVGGVLTRLRERLGARAVQVALPRELPMVQVDGVLIEQVLANLVENALKYTPPESPILISAAADDAAVVVSVEDRGPGLPPGDEERVFDKFYQGAPERSQSGVGLGLTICRALVEAHGGRIWAENAPGGGAVFRFTLPLTGEPPTIDAAAGDAGAEP
jgi:two-component system sensor histidine kinase KdpD